MANRIIAIGDIHGCAVALEGLLRQIQPRATDLLIPLGDYVDRGPHSAQVLEMLVDLIGRCSLIPLIGNHEIMMANGLLNRGADLDFWLQYGGQSTLNSYGGELHNVPAHHRTFINHCRRHFETDRHFFVHANFDPVIPLIDQPDDVLFWQHILDEVPDPHFSGKTAIVGHTPQVEGEIRDLGHVKIIDTFCCGDKYLTAVDVTTGRVWQVDAGGRPRDGASHFAVDGNPAANRPNAVPSQLEFSGDRFREDAHKVIDWLAEHLDSLATQPVLANQRGRQLAREIEEPVPQRPTELATLLKRLFQDYIPTSFNTASPGYLAYIPAGGITDAALASLIATATNRYVTVWHAAPVLAQIESTVVRWFCEIMGYSESSGGYLASGGSMATLTAVITARVKLLQHDFSKATIYCSNQVHHCIHKAAFLAGFPRENIRSIGVDTSFAILPGDLQRTIEQDAESGMRPFLLVGSAGTTNTGAVDDLTQLADLAKAHGLWYHVDAAYGGFFALTERGKKRLAGIHRADSIVLDPHKGLFMPYGSGCLLVRRRDDLLRAHQFTSEYMPQMTRDRQREDICEISPELSRGNRGLPIWLPIKRHGIDAFRELLDEKLDLAEWTWEQLASLAQQLDGKLEIVAQPQLTIMAFRLVIQDRSTDQLNDLNRRWLQEINNSQQVMLTGTIVDGRFVLRVCILSFRTHRERMQQCIDVLQRTAASVLEGQA